MVYNFSKGNNYTDVWYGEYVIIDTHNKNDKDNGKIFRRGLDYQNEWGGAEYIGQIVGPSSGTPYVEVSDIPHVMEHAKINVDNDVSYKRYPTGYKIPDPNNPGKEIDAKLAENGAYSLVEGGHYIVSAGGDENDLPASYNFNKNNKVLIPGKEKDTGKWNDNIRYTWVNVRDDTNAADSWFYVGFEIPYMVIDYVTRSVSPYDDDGQYRDMIRVDRLDENADDTEVEDIDLDLIDNHPFWEKWRFDVPRGIKGDTLHNFRVTTLAEENAAGRKVYNLSAVSTTWSQEQNRFITVVDEEDLYVDIDHTELHDPSKWNDNRKYYDGPTEDQSYLYEYTIGESINQGPRQILVFDYIVYDNKAEGDYYTIFLGDYNNITGINVDHDGTVRIQMTHDNEYVYEQCIHWIDLIALTEGNGTSGGHFTFTWNYNHENEDGTFADYKQTSEFDISWIKTVALEQDGSVTYTYAGIPDVIPDNPYDESPETTFEEEGCLDTGVYKVDDFLQWVEKLKLDSNNGHLMVTANTSRTDYQDKYEKDILFEADLNWNKIHLRSPEDYLNLANYHLLD